MPEIAVNQEVFYLRWDVRPFTVNGERRMHMMERANLVRKWRQAFALLAREAEIPQLEDVRINVTPYLKDRRGVQDVAACAPAAKAAIDGLIDAGVLEDDNPQFVKFLGFHAPEFGDGNGLELEITGTVVAPRPKKKVAKGYDRRYNNGRAKFAQLNGCNVRT